MMNGCVSSEAFGQKQYMALQSHLKINNAGENTHSEKHQRGMVSMWL